MSWFSALFRCLGKRRESEDLTAFSGEMPPFKTKTESTTFANYINGESFIVENRTIVETKRIDDHRDRGSDQDMHVDTKDMAIDGESVSDQSTLTGDTGTETRDLESYCEYDQGIASEENTDAEIPKVSNDAIFPCPSFVDNMTGERMVDLIQVTTIGLNHCEIKGAESRIPNSDKDEIEVLFHYGGKNIWVYVPYGYVKGRDDFK